MLLKLLNVNNCNFDNYVLYPYNVKNIVKHEGYHGPLAFQYRLKLFTCLLVCLIYIHLKLSVLNTC